jgi:hypothetical protein
MSFSSSYVEARAAFRAAASSASARLEAIPITGTSPEGEALTIDVAELGAPEASACVLVSSGLHGVEGFAGSAIQRASLERGLRPSPGVRLLLIHALNPWGFAHGRRVDRENIDLNRSFLAPSDPRPDPPGFEAHRYWLAPRLAPRRFEPFTVQLLLRLLRHGRASLTRAIASGQYSDPQGLFYGGREASELQRCLAEQLRAWLGPAERVVHFDLHTGLGRKAAMQLFVPCEQGTPLAEWLVGRFGPATRARPAAGPRYYTARGDLLSWCENLADRPYLGCTVEFGTHGGQFVLRALYLENRAHHHGSSSTADQASQRLLVQAFAPTSKRWRERVVDQGVAVIATALASIEHDWPKLRT